MRLATVVCAELTTVYDHYYGDKDMSEETKVTSESPFCEVLNQWGEELIEQEERLSEMFAGIVIGKNFTLKSGVQVKIEIGRDIIEED